MTLIMACFTFDPPDGVNLGYPQMSCFTCFTFDTTDTTDNTPDGTTDGTPDNRYDIRVPPNIPSDTSDKYRIETQIPYTSDVANKPVHDPYPNTFGDVAIDLPVRVGCVPDCICVTCFLGYPTWGIPAILLICPSAHNPLSAITILWLKAMVIGAPLTICVGMCVALKWSEICY